MICTQLRKKSAEEKQIAKEGSNWDPPDHEATALPFALQNLHGEVDSSRALIRNTKRYTHGIQRVHV